MVKSHYTFLVIVPQPDKQENFSADAVIEALIEKLHGDKSFKAWLTTKEDVAKVAEALETTAQNS